VAASIPEPASGRDALIEEVGKQTFQLKGFEAAWGYAQAVKVGSLIYVSGTVAIDADGNPLARGDMAEQVRLVYADVVASLAAHGATLSDVVREALVTTDIRRFLAEGAAVRLAAYAGHSLPASAPWMEVRRLAHEEFLFEVEVTAIAT
jgi:enamine deaminase RidA (YjgF/YER057c/UK114 family)